MTEAITLGDNTRAVLRDAVRSFESLQRDVDAAREDQKQVVADAKKAGIDPKTFRAAIRERKRTADQREDERALLDLYLDAL